MNSLATALLLVATLMASPAANAATSRAGRPTATLEAEALIIPLDGTEATRCRVGLAPAAGGRSKAWISFGTVASGPDEASGSWRATSARGDCGGGTSGSASAPGTAYLIQEIVAKQAGGGRAAASVTLETRKLSGFDSDGRPTYQRAAERTVAVGAESDTLLPLLLPDDRERQAFGVHDAWLRLRVRNARPAAAYGTLSVEADVPGAEIFLDGGPVGRVSERAPVTLRNVLAGEREIAVRDASGREARRRLTIVEGQTAAIQLAVLDLPSAAPDQGLLPIGKNPQGYEEYWRLTDQALVVRVPAGEFLMGTAEGQGEPHERPQHRVQVSDFLIDKLEVTWRQLRRYADSTGSSLPPAPAWGAQEDYAASNVQWTEAQAYCEWVGGRLPTEAEWEKAARGIDGRLYTWGDQWDADRCNGWEGGPHRPRSAGSFANCVSPYGVLEMPGGVWEWCSDWYAEGYDAASAVPDPTGPASGSMRVLRGGSWLNQSSWLRVAYRFRNDPLGRNVHHGFRCAQRVPS